MDEQVSQQWKQHLIKILNKKFKTEQECTFALSILMKFRYFKKLCNDQLNQIDAKSLNQLVSNIQIQHFKKNQTIIQQGELSNGSLYMIIDGEVEILKKNKTNVFIEQNNYIRKSQENIEVIQQLRRASIERHKIQKYSYQKTDFIDKIMGKIYTKFFNLQFLENDFLEKYFPLEHIQYHYNLISQNTQQSHNTLNYYFPPPSSNSLDSSFQKWQNQSYDNNSNKDKSSSKLDTKKIKSLNSYTNFMNNSKDITPKSTKSQNNSNKIINKIFEKNSLKQLQQVQEDLKGEQKITSRKNIEIPQQIQAENQNINNTEFKVENYYSAEKNFPNLNTKNKQNNKIVASIVIKTTNSLPKDQENSKNNEISLQEENLEEENTEIRQKVASVVDIESEMNSSKDKLQQQRQILYKQVCAMDFETLNNFIQESNIKLSEQENYSLTNSIRAMYGEKVAHISVGDTFGELAISKYDKEMKKQQQQKDQDDKKKKIKQNEKDKKKMQKKRNATIFCKTDTDVIVLNYQFSSAVFEKFDKQQVLKQEFLLENIPYLNEVVNEETFRELIYYFREDYFSCHQKITQQGISPNNLVYFLAEGNCKIKKKILHPVLQEEQEYFISDISSPAIIGDEILFTNSINSVNQQQDQQSNNLQQKLSKIDKNQPKKIKSISEISSQSQLETNLNQKDNNNNPEILESKYNYQYTVWVTSSRAKVFWIPRKSLINKFPIMTFHSLKQSYKQKELNRQNIVKKHIAFNTPKQEVISFKDLQKINLSGPKYQPPQSIKITSKKDVENIKLNKEVPPILSMFYSKTRLKQQQKKQKQKDIKLKEIYETRINVYNNKKIQKNNNQQPLLNQNKDYEINPDQELINISHSYNNQNLNSLPVSPKNSQFKQKQQSLSISPFPNNNFQSDFKDQIQENNSFQLSPNNNNINRQLNFQEINNFNKTASFLNSPNNSVLSQDLNQNQIYNINQNYQQQQQSLIYNQQLENLQSQIKQQEKLEKILHNDDIINQKLKQFKKLQLQKSGSDCDFYKQSKYKQLLKSPKESNNFIYIDRYGQLKQNPDNRMASTQINFLNSPNSSTTNRFATNSLFDKQKYDYSQSISKYQNDDTNMEKSQENINNNNKLSKNIPTISEHLNTVSAPCSPLKSKRNSIKNTQEKQQNYNIEEQKQFLEMNSSHKIFKKQEQNLGNKQNQDNKQKSTSLYTNKYSVKPSFSSSNLDKKNVINSFRITQSTQKTPLNFSNSNNNSLQKSQNNQNQTSMGFYNKDITKKQLNLNDSNNNFQKKIQKIKEQEEKNLENKNVFSFRKKKDHFQENLKENKNYEILLKSTQQNLSKKTSSMLYKKALFRKKEFLSVLDTQDNGDLVISKNFNTPLENQRKLNNNQVFKSSSLDKFKQINNQNNNTTYNNHTNSNNIYNSINKGQYGNQILSQKKVQLNFNKNTPIQDVMRQFLNNQNNNIL